MRRIRVIAAAAGVAALTALLAPGVAGAAGMFTWNLTSDFTSTGAGANPDHDQYSGTPWTYVEGPIPAVPGVFGHDPSAFTRLTSFATSDAVHAGLAGWSDTTDPTAFIGINPTGAAISQPPVSYPSQAIAVQPPADRLVAVGWTSPFNTTVPVTVDATVAADDADPGCVLRADPQWSLDQNGSELVPASPPSGPVSQVANVDPGGTIYLTITPGASSSCSNVSLALTIRAAAGAPAVTLVSPAGGATIAGGQPTFAGSAGSDFGDSPAVKVRVNAGTSATGDPLETLDTTASGGAYQIQPTTPLADGTYTAQAEQDDVLSPPQAGLSARVTFTVENGGPKVMLKSLGSKAVRTSTPTVTGTAGTASGDASTVAIGVYSGAGESGSPVRAARVPVGTGGSFSLKLSPALRDGEYTAVAAQNGAAGVGISQPMMFVVKANAPTVTLTTPACGASVVGSTPVFSGSAGTGIGDSRTITVAVYKGGAVRGRPVGTATATASGGKWSLIWPHQLPLGLYIAQVSQSDNAGHTAKSAAHRFLIVPGPKVIGPTVRLDRSGDVSVPITCLAPAGAVCDGDVLIVTQGKFKPAAGGPLGRLRLLFKFVKIPAGKTVQVSAKVASSLARILRRAAPLKVEVTVALKANGKVTAKLTGGSTLRLR